MPLAYSHYITFLQVKMKKILLLIVLALVNAHAIWNMNFQNLQVIDYMLIASLILLIGVLVYISFVKFSKRGE